MPITGFSVNLNTLHKRAGGTSETTCSLNDTDIKDLKFSGAGTALGDHKTSLAESYVVGNVSGGSSGGFYGYSEGATGLDDITTTFILDRIYTGWDWTVLMWANTNPGYFILRADEDTSASNPDSASNSGWEVLIVGTTEFYRQDATYSNPGGSDAMQWLWTTANSIYDGVNPYPTNGNDEIIRFG
jgi:hypothetical protein